MNRSSLILLVALLVTCASCAMSNVEPANVPLGACVVGLWVRTPQACDCSFGVTPECGQPTCREFLTAWSVAEDGTMADLTLRLTTGAPRTVSVASSVLPGTWALVEPGQLDRRHGGLPDVGPVTCSETSLAWSGIDFARAAPEIERAITPVLGDAERWTGLPY